MHVGKRLCDFLQIIGEWLVVAGEQGAVAECAKPSRFLDSQHGFPRASTATNGQARNFTEHVQDVVLLLCESNDMLLVFAQVQAEGIPELQSGGNVFGEGLHQPTARFRLCSMPPPALLRKEKCGRFFRPEKTLRPVG